MKKSYNAANEKDVKKKEEEQKLKRKQELNDIKQILNTSAGVRFFKRFIRLGNIFRTTFTGRNEIYFLEGHRNFALVIFSDICKASPNKVNELIIEKEEDE